MKLRAENLYGLQAPLLETLRVQANRVSRLMGRAAPRDDWDAVIVLRSLAAVLSRSLGTVSNVPGSYQSAALGPDEKLVIIPVQATVNGRQLLEEPVGVLLRSGSIDQVLTGPRLLGLLLDIAEKGASRISPMPVLSKKEELIAASKAKSVIRNRLQSLRIQHQALARELEESIGNTIDPSGGIVNVKVSVGSRLSYLVIKGGPSCNPPRLSLEDALDAAGDKEKIIDVENDKVLKNKLSVEARALMLVKQYEIEHGRNPVDVHLEKSYNIESYNPFTLEVERYIEVKAHRGMEGTVELTEKEYEFALRNRDKYWLYLVVGLDTDKPYIITIHDPVGKLGLRKVRKKQVIEKEETRYVAEVDVAKYLGS